MIRIDDTLLEEIGLIALPKPERDQMLRQIYETLEMRVGMRLAERMSDQQLDEFERFIDTNDEAGALKWLETNFPDYKQVVADELDKLKGEIKKDSGQILQAMQVQGGQPTPQPAHGSQPAAAPSQFTQPQQSASQFGATAATPTVQPQSPAAQPLQPLPVASPSVAPAAPNPQPMVQQPTPPQPLQPASAPQPQTQNDFSQSRQTPVQDDPASNDQAQAMPSNPPGNVPPPPPMG